MFFHWSGDWSSSVPGVYTLDHVGLIVSVNSNGTYTTIEGNTGSSAYGECAIRTRYESQISCAGRPKYGTGSSSSSSTSTSSGTTTKTSKILLTIGAVSGLIISLPFPLSFKYP